MQTNVSSQNDPRKHPCHDCKMCQNCSDSRCVACRAGASGNKGRKLSISEQIALYDRLNPFLGPESAEPCLCSAAVREHKARHEGE